MGSQLSGKGEVEKTFLRQARILSRRTQGSNQKVWDNRMPRVQNDRMLADLNLLKLSLDGLPIKSISS